jgi:hypothetical protein
MQVSLVLYIAMKRVNIQSFLLIRVTGTYKVWVFLVIIKFYYDLEM